MTDIWVISDTHFNHGNIIKYCDRPYTSTTEMDWDMVSKWNSVVKPGDKVYHLGDVYMKASNGYIDNVLSSLNGQKRLILGNHDNGADQILLKHFKKIYLWRHFKEFGLHLSHVPLRRESIFTDCVNIHGHTHDQGSPEGPYRSVCVELIDYTPVNIEELRVR
jgi:calcineurin-like phosphoesterase family protein